MDYPSAIEEACRRAYNEADEQAINNLDRSHAYLKHLATARFYEVVAEEDIDISDKSVGDIAVDLLKGVDAVREAI